MRFTTLLLTLSLAVPAFSAGITGKWAISVADGDGNVHKPDMVVQEDGSALKAEFRLGTQTIPLNKVKFESEELSFEMPWQNMMLTFKLKLSGDELKGNVFTDSGDSIPATGKRASDAAAATGDLAGKWKFVATTEDGRDRRFELELKQTGTTWAGTLANDGGSIPLSSVTVDGAQVSFKLETGDGDYTVKLAQAGAELKGTFAAPNGGSGTVKATR